MSWLHRFDATRIDEICRKWAIKGCSVAVVQQDEEGTWAERTLCFGERNEDHDKVDADTRFFIASNSKLFCVLAAAMALEENGYSKGLKTRIKEVVPAYQLQEASLAEVITFEDAFAFVTGLPRHDLYTSHDVSTLDQQLRVIAGMRPSLGHREATQYHNPHYDLIALIVERLTGQDFSSYVNKKILEPLGMPSTSVSVKAALESSNYAQGFWQQHETLESPGRAIPLPCGLRDDSAACMGAGRMASSARDMARWLQTLLNEGRHPQTGKQVISASLIKRCLTGTVRFYDYIMDYPELSPAVYGLGMCEQAYSGHNIVEHGGSVPGYMSRFTLVPRLQTKTGLFIVVNNSPWGYLACEEIKYELLDDLFGLPKLDWNARFMAQKSRALEGRASNFTKAVAVASDSKSEENNNNDLKLDPAALVGTYTAPGFHVYSIDKEHVLTAAPSSAELWDVPVLTQLWCKVQPVLWRRGPSHLDYKMCLQCSVPVPGPGPGQELENMLGLPCDVEVSVEQGKVVGLGLRNIWGAGKDVPSPEGSTVRERAEIFLDKID